MVLQAMPVFQQQQPVFVDDRRRNLIRRVARIVMREGHVKRIQFDRFLFDLASGVGQGEQNAISPAMMQRFHCRCTRLFAQEQFEAGPFAAQARQHPWQKEWRDCGDHAHPHFTRERLAARLDKVGEFFRLAQDAMGFGDDLISQRGEADRPFRPLDQCNAKQGFEIAQSG